MTEIHIGKAIRERLDELGMTKAEFARRIHTTRQNVNSLLERPHLDAGLLRNISQVLGRNFFKAYTEGLEDVDEYAPTDKSNLGLCIGIRSKEELVRLWDLLEEAGWG